jgi:hypothetical protein
MCAMKDADSSMGMHEPSTIGGETAAKIENELHHTVIPTVVPCDHLE